MRVTQEYNFGEKGLAWISEGKLGQLGASSARLKSKKPNDKLVLRHDDNINHFLDLLL